MKPLECQELQEALGMASGAISDEQISASSQHDDNHAATQGRLHFQKTGKKQGAWAAATKDVNQWLQIDLRSYYTRVKRVATQGRNGYDQWVAKYKLQYSNNGENFRFYREQGQTTDKVK